MESRVKMLDNLGRKEGKNGGRKERRKEVNTEGSLEEAFRKIN